MGTTGITAQAHGQSNASETRAVLVQSLLTGLGIALLIILLQNPIIYIGTSLMQGSEQVSHYALIYCQWMIWGAPAVMVLFSVSGWFLGMQNAFAALTVGVVVNIVNIVLDILFVIYLKMDVRGVALASVIAQYAGVFLAMLMIRKQLRYGKAAWSFERVMDLNKLKRFWSLNHNIFIRTVCLLLVFVFFTKEGARYGDSVLAANSILMKFYLLMAMVLDGFNHAAETLVGKAVGIRSETLFNKAVSLTLRWSFWFGLAFCMFFWIGGSWLINVLTDIDTVKETANHYLPWVIALPLFSVWCFLLDGIFIGATRGPEMRNAMLLCTFVFFLPIWYIFRPFG